VEGPHHSLRGAVEAAGAGGQGHDMLFALLGLGGQHEGSERFAGRQACFGDVTFDAAAGAIGEFGFEFGQCVEQVRSVPTVLSAPAVMSGQRRATVGSYVSLAQPRY